MPSPIWLVWRCSDGVMALGQCSAPNTNPLAALLVACPLVVLCHQPQLCDCVLCAVTVQSIGSGYLSLQEVVPFLDGEALWKHPPGQSS